MSMSELCFDFSYCFSCDCCGINRMQAFLLVHFVLYLFFVGVVGVGSALH